MNLKTLNDKYIRSKDGYWKRHHRIDEQVEELKAKQERLRHPHLELFNPLLEQIKERLGAESIVHYGGFGLSNENSYYFKKEGKKRKKEIILGHIVFISYGDGWAIRNERKDSGFYGNGTIGEMNGMNHPTIPMTDKMNVDYLVERMRARRPRKW